MKRYLAALLALLMILALAGCGAQDRDLRAEQNEIMQNDPKRPQPSEAPEGEDAQGAEQSPTPAAEPLPTATSADVELFVLNPGTTNAYVVNAYGQKATSYTVDVDGNIRDRSDKIVVAAANTSTFAYMATADFSQRTYDATLNAKEEADKDDPNITSVKQYAVNITITLSAGPSQATNGVIAISSSNAAVAEIRANNNAKLIAEGAYELEAGELAIHTEDNGVAKIVVTAKTAGTATIVARSLAGTARAECVINVKNGEIQVKTTPAPENLTDTINASNDPTMHTHQYTATVVQPTPYEKGYTIYTCSCGHSYIDNYTSPLPMPTPEATPHVHHYTASVVAPTATERGYTLHVCQECGDSYKDAYVAPTGG